MSKTPIHSVHVESIIPEILSDLSQRAEQFDVEFHNGDFLDAEINRIAAELKTTATYFAIEQGLHVDIYGRPTNLIQHIKAEPKGNYKGGHYIKFYNDAEHRGRYYASYVEYGHHSRNRQLESYVVARPFMRPALYAVAEASKGNVSRVLGNLLRGTFFQTTKEGVARYPSQLQFGHALCGQKNKGNISKRTVNGLKNTKIGREGFSNQDRFIERTGLNYSNIKGSLIKGNRQKANKTSSKESPKKETRKPKQLKTTKSYQKPLKSTKKPRKTSNKKSKKKNNKKKNNKKKKSQRKQRPSRVVSFLKE